jgi:hypothetical protein
VESRGGVDCGGSGIEGDGICRGGLKSECVVGGVRDWVDDEGSGIEWKGKFGGGL